MDCEKWGTKMMCKNNFEEARFLFALCLLKGHSSLIFKPCLYVPLISIFSMWGLWRLTVLPCCGVLPTLTDASVAVLRSAFQVTDQVQQCFSLLHIINTHTCMYAHIHLHTYTNTHGRSYVYTHKCTHACIRKCTRTHTDLHFPWLLSFDLALLFLTSPTLCSHKYLRFSA